MGKLFDNDKFEIIIDDLKIMVSEHTLQDQQVYRLVFADNRAPLVITQVSTWEGGKWTSVPQGRQKEAELFGKEISNYFKNK